MGFCTYILKNISDRQRCKFPLLAVRGRNPGPCPNVRLGKEPLQACRLFRFRNGHRAEEGISCSEFSLSPCVRMAERKRSPRQDTSAIIIANGPPLPLCQS